MDALVCADGNRMLSDMERRSSSEEAIIDFIFCSVISECTLVSGIFWDGISDSRPGGDYSNVDSDSGLHSTIPKSFQARFGTDDSLFALGFICYRLEFLDLVVELKMQEPRSKR